MHLCIFEDPSVKRLQPLTYLTPVFELRCGCTSLREKILFCLPIKKISLATRPYLAEYTKECFPRYPVNTPVDDDVLFVNGRVLADASLIQFFKQHTKTETVAMNGDDIVAAYVKSSRAKSILKQIRNDGIPVNLFSSLPSVAIQTKLINYPWDLVNNNADEIERDVLALKKGKKTNNGKIYPGAHLLNKKNILIGTGSVIKPGVVLDAEHGPIVIGKNVTVMPNAVIEGPAYIGYSTTIRIGAKIYPGVSIGKECKIGGEVTRSIIQSYSNKAHDGFIGDSYIGSWVNLGADTNTSNLKNTYGNVTVFINGKPVESNRQFVGLTMGDHSKSGINFMFNTGSVVGISCNIFGGDFPPKYLPSFSWGSADQFETFDIEKSIEVARRMMERRGITMSAAYETMMRSVFNQTKQERNKWLTK